MYQFHYLSHYLKRQLNELYISTVILDFGSFALAIFIPIYFFKLGFSARQIIIWYAVHYIFYALLCPLIAKIVAKAGYENSIAVSIPFYAIFLFSAILVGQFSWLFYFAAFLWAFDKSFYWLAYHSDFSRYSQTGSKGEEVGFLRVLIGLTGVVAPAVGGFILAKAGFAALFVVAISFAFLSLIPLLMTREPKIEEDYDFKRFFKVLASKAYRPDVIANMGHGADVIAQAVWPIFLFLIVPDYRDVGILTTAVLFITFVLVLIFGKLSNKPQRAGLIKSTSAGVAFFWFLKTLIYDWSTGFIIHSVYKIFRDAMEVPMQTLFYERPNGNRILEYVVFREVTLSIGKIIVALACFALLFFTDNLIYTFLLAGLFTLFNFFWREKLITPE